MCGICTNNPSHRLLHSIVCIYIFIILHNVLFKTYFWIKAETSYKWPEYVAEWNESFVQAHLPSATLVDITLWQTQQISA